MDTVAPAGHDLHAVEERVVAVVQRLAGELGGHRAATAASSADASLQRDIGLGSLERVELLSRLEKEFGRRLDESCLRIDTAAGLARALVEGGLVPAEMPPAREESVAASTFRVTASTVHGALWQRAQADPERPQVYMREEDGTEHTVRFGPLLSQSAAVAGGLREKGIRKGDTVALMLPTGLDFLRSFQGILIAGAIPVPIYPPVRLDRLDEYAQRQSAILRDAGVRALITIPKALGVAAVLRSAVPSLGLTTTADDLAGLGASWSAPEGDASDPAFIQYTSGSTGLPKGVLLTHANLLANMTAIGRGLHATPGDVGASWLPLYHDMGLIGSWLFCMHAGLPIAIQSPLSFLSRPERWLWTIHQRRVTLSPAPNFAYELCVRRISDQAIEGLDLSSWRCALNGAEPVSPETLERFVKRFEPYGFRREAMLPVYGLAENSVALCFPPPGRGPRVIDVAREPFERDRVASPAPAGDPRPLRFVSVGSVLPEHEVRIVDEAGAPLPERAVGRLVFRGPSAMAGYFNKPDATAAISLPDSFIDGRQAAGVNPAAWADGGVVATLLGPQTPFIDSGDLAFVADGEIYIAGRKKDLIIKAGRNLVPQEIEEAASSVPGIRKGCVVAVGVLNATLGTESLVIVAETRATGAERDALATAVVERVSDIIGVPPDTVALVPPGAVPKTSSGKVRRAETKALYEKGTLGEAGGSALGSRARVLGGALWGEARRRLAIVPRLLWAAYFGLVLLVLVPPFWLLTLVTPGGRRQRALARGGARLLLRTMGYQLSREGAEQLDGLKGPVVIASNHASYVDVLALLALLPRDYLYVAKNDVLGWPVFGRYVRSLGHLAVDRWDAAQGVADAEAVTRAIADGTPVVFFPEATFTRAAGLRPFRLGAFKAAADTGAVVVPVALRGTRAALPSGQAIPRPGRLHAWIGAPRRAEGREFADLVRLRDAIADDIGAHCGEPRLDLVAAGPDASLAPTTAGVS